MHRVAGGGVESDAHKIAAVEVHAAHVSYSVRDRRPLLPKLKSGERPVAQGAESASAAAFKRHETCST